MRWTTLNGTRNPLVNNRANQIVFSFLVGIPPPSGDYLLENGTDKFLLEDGTGVYVLDDG